MSLIHKEGRSILITFTLSILIILIFTFLLIENTVISLVISLISITFLGFCFYFFRNPYVSIYPDSEYILAPAEGKIVVIEETMEKEYLKRDCLLISIFMSPLNIHVNRSPVDGIVQYFKYHKGKYWVAWHPKSSEENERTTMVLKHSYSNHKVLIRQIAGAVARRIKYYIQPEQTLTQGEEFGFIKFGSRVDIFLPLGTNILVKLNQKTKAGKTILAQLPKKNI